MAGTANSGGRNKKSGTVHLLSGTFRRDRHTDAVAPEPPSGRPDPPAPLEGMALAEWTRMVDRLDRSKTLTVVDDAALYQYARLFAETEQLAEARGEAAATVKILEENLSDLEGPDLVAAFQEIAKMRQLEARYAVQTRQGRLAIRQYLVEFGMTPSARTRVRAIGPAKPASKVDQFRAKHA